MIYFNSYNRLVHTQSNVDSRLSSNIIRSGRESAILLLCTVYMCYFAYTCVHHAHNKNNYYLFIKNSTVHTTCFVKNARHSRHFSMWCMLSWRIIIVIVD